MVIESVNIPFLSIFAPQEPIEKLQAYRFGHLENQLNKP